MNICIYFCWIYQKDLTLIVLFLKNCSPEYFLFLLIPLTFPTKWRTISSWYELNILITWPWYIKSHSWLRGTNIQFHSLIIIIYELFSYESILPCNKYSWINYFSYQDSIEATSLLFILWCILYHFKQFLCNIQN